MRGLLVVGQVSLTTLLLVGAGLLVQSLVRLQRVPVGVNADSVLTAKLSLTRARLPNGAAIDAFLSRLTSDLQSTPGITAAGISSAIPLSPGAYTITQVAAEADPFLTCGMASRRRGLLSHLPDSARSRPALRIRGPSRMRRASS